MVVYHREGDESCVCEPASARLSLQAMRLSYFKNSDFTPSLQSNIMLGVSQLKLFNFHAVFAARSLISVCNNVCVRASMKARRLLHICSFGLVTNPSLNLFIKH